MDAISRVWYNGSYTIAAKTIKTLELHYDQFLPHGMYIHRQPRRAVSEINL